MAHVIECHSVVIILLCLQSVVPLNEETGLIEWVPNLEAFRVIISKIYKEMGCFTTNKEIRKYMVGQYCVISFLLVLLILFLLT